MFHCLLGDLQPTPDAPAELEVELCYPPTQLNWGASQYWWYFCGNWQLGSSIYFLLGSICRCRRLILIKKPRFKLHCDFHREGYFTNLALHLPLKWGSTFPALLDPQPYHVTYFEIILTGSSIIIQTLPVSSFCVWFNQTLAVVSLVWTANS